MSLSVMRFYRKIKNCTADYGCTVFVLYVILSEYNIVRICTILAVGDC